MKSKTDTVKGFVAKGDYRNALRLAKNFQYGISREQHDAMLRAYEGIVHPDFYRQLFGRSLEREIRKGVDILVSLYG